ncbi:hypothetical protein ABT174_41695 [Streptomyces sparsogenes]|uniref:hypothetical protein n=1 Tax=Streptomyces sparsogenes TaxID=67365 RepID=UPI00332EB799
MCSASHAEVRAARGRPAPGEARGSGRPARNSRLARRTHLARIPRGRPPTRSRATNTAPKHTQRSAAGHDRPAPAATASATATGGRLHAAPASAYPQPRTASAPNSGRVVLPADVFPAGVFHTDVFHTGVFHTGASMVADPRRPPPP